MSFSLRGPDRKYIGEIKKLTYEKLAKAVAKSVDATIKETKVEIKSAMASAKLGKLSGAIGSGSDVSRNRVPDINQVGVARWRAGGFIVARGNSLRTSGALDAYINGAVITPKKGRWLWISTKEIPRRVGRYRMTPALYVKGGFEKKIGELTFVKGKNAGEAFLIARNVQVNKALGFGRAQRIPKTGNLRPGKVKRDTIIAFIGIRVTRRDSRFNPVAIGTRVAQGLPAKIVKYLTGNITPRRQNGPIVISTSTSFTI